MCERGRVRTVTSAGTPSGTGAVSTTEPLVSGQTAVYTVRFGGWTTQLMLEHYHREDPIHGADDRLRWWVWAFENTRSKNDVSAPPADTRVR